MKIAQLLGKDFGDALVTLGQASLPMSAAYRIKKIVKRVNEELLNYNELLESARKKATDENGNVDNNAFMKSYSELVNIEVEIPTISISELSSLTLTAKDLMFLEPLIDDPELKAEEAAKADKATPSQDPAP
jgi:hypothetical protein